MINHRTALTISPSVNEASVEYRNPPTVIDSLTDDEASHTATASEEKDIP
jgi:hypothetical protein